MHQILTEYIPFALLLILVVSALIRLVSHAHPRHHA
jgi:hypothetical protein